MAGACQDQEQRNGGGGGGRNNNNNSATDQKPTEGKARTGQTTTDYAFKDGRDHSNGRTPITNSSGDDINHHHHHHHHHHHQTEPKGNTVKPQGEFGELALVDEADATSSSTSSTSAASSTSSPLSEALLAVASAEEYAAKITKLQQACLTPLKEDLAEWLNKILNVSTITTENFMDKLDNGVIICKLAKIISTRCSQQLTTSGQVNQLPQQQKQLQQQQQQQQVTTHNRISSSQLKLNQSTYASSTHQYSNSNQPSRNLHISHSSKLSISTNNVHSAININDKLTDVENAEPFYDRRNNTLIESVIATPLRQPQFRLPSYSSGSGPLRSFSQSINCLTSSSTTNLNNGFSSGNRFLNNLIWMNQTKIWEDAKCRTFYARDNVCNFIRWSKEFGVNQSVLFESDDLVLHANTRQVVLCLLDVARIAFVKHGFTEAPGLIKFEQEINRELAAEKAALENNAQISSDGCMEEDIHTNGIPANKKRSGLARNSRGASIVDATDDLITRYCLHKEEEAARNKAAELEAAAKLEAEAAAERERAAVLAASQKEAETTYAEPSLPSSTSPQPILSVSNLDEPAITSKKDVDVEDEESKMPQKEQEEEEEEEAVVVEEEALTLELDSLITGGEDKGSIVMKSPSGESLTQKHNITYDNRGDSLDSGEGRTESASTSHSRTPVNTPVRKMAPSSIPLPIKRSNSSSSLVSNHTSSIGTSELSSSHSSLLSGKISNSSNKRHIASDLDGKVMRIAKSYYGKGATKGVTRLSEGKYKIADRIVFVRLLKGHRVMVRIGGGWDTLENFLFRHKSDPSQVINLDNLLPIETKMSFKKSPQQPSTPNNN